MSLLLFEHPKRIRGTKEHNSMYMSDSGVEENRIKKTVKS